MRHVVITQPPPGLWTATIKTYRGDTLLDESPYSISFIIADHFPDIDEGELELRPSPWDESGDDVWGSSWGLALPAGSARCAASGDDGTLERCVLSNAMAANRSFFLWPGQRAEATGPDSRQHRGASEDRRQHRGASEVGPLRYQPASSEGFSLYACAGGLKSSCWGQPAPLRVRYLMDEEERRAAGVCDTIVMGSAVVFTLPYMGSPLAVLMSGLVPLVASLRDADLGDGIARGQAPLLIR